MEVKLISTPEIFLLSVTISDSKAALRPALKKGEVFFKKHNSSAVNNFEMQGCTDLLMS